MATRTRFVFLMHPKEFKEEKAGTGRLTHLCLPNSELHMGKGFDGDGAVQALINDPKNFPVLLYPGKDALNLSTATELQVSAFSLAATRRDESPEASAKGDKPRVSGRQVVVFLLDATWSGARKMLRLSPSLQRLPRIMFTPSAPSRYVIKQQPVEGSCPRSRRCTSCSRCSPGRGSTSMRSRSSCSGFSSACRISRSAARPTRTAAATAGSPTARPRRACGRRVGAARAG